MEPKADANYPIVSAASICAKVNRDEKIKSLESAIGAHIGCGYSHDEQTIKWMDSNIDNVFGYKNYVRFSWETTVKKLNDHNVNVCWDEKKPDQSQLNLVSNKCGYLNNLQIEKNCLKMLNN